jgi:hypothetical protein
MTTVKELELSQGKVALLDAEDFEWLSQWKWSARRHHRRTLWYAVRGVQLADGRHTTVQLHRQILDAPVHLQVDHIDGNGLNNRRGNLRLATAAQNARNRRVISGTSGFKGVHFHKRDRRWRADIEVDRKTVCLGYFHTPEEAADAYDAAALEHFGEFACTNEMIAERGVA